MYSKKRKDDKEVLGDIEAREEEKIEKRRKLMSMKLLRK